MLQKGREKMKYETAVYFKDEGGGIYRPGDTVTIKFPNGGGIGGCVIVKVTSTGFHYHQGAGRIKSVQFKDIDEVYHHCRLIKD